MIKRKIGRAIAGFLLSLSIVTGATAQVSELSPPVPTPNDRFQLFWFQKNASGLDLALLDTVNGIIGRVPVTERERVLRDRAGLWIRQLAEHPIAGMQYESMGSLHLSSGNEVLARQAFDTRINAAGLSQRDKAYALRFAVQTFADDTTYINTALEYMMRLDKLPPTENAYKFMARIYLARGYEDLGDSPSAVKNYRIAIALLHTIPFVQRLIVFHDFNPGSIMSGVVGGLSLNAGVKSVIDSLGKEMLQLVALDKATLAQETKDSLYRKSSNFLTKGLKDEIYFLKWVGEKMPAVVGTHWYNTTPPASVSDAAPGARQVPLNTGRIQVFQFGNRGCAACLPMLKKMAKLAKQLGPDVGWWYVTPSEQRWGLKECTPDESAEHIRKYYLDHHKVTAVPIAVWAPPVDDSTISPGALLQRAHPTYEKLGITGVPVFLVVDGNGIVRKASGAGSNFERDFTRFIKVLLAEQKRKAAPTIAFSEVSISQVLLIESSEK